MFLIEVNLFINMLPDNSYQLTYIYIDFIRIVLVSKKIKAVLIYLVPLAFEID